MTIGNSVNITNGIYTLDLVKIGMRSIDKRFIEMPHNRDPPDNLSDSGAYVFFNVQVAHVREYICLCVSSRRGEQSSLCSSNCRLKTNISPQR